ncbi:MAG TPA: GTPase [Kineosporiaceae bacterium]|nr:GTPase [Kineosporiaceae bacterium]
MSERLHRAQEIVAKASALATALEVGDERFEPQAREVAESTLARAGERLQLGGTHTIVALVGATGSGKSSLFNALSGMEIADVGARRPLTAQPMACVWGEDAGPLLDWLEVPEGRRVTRESVLDADREADLRGLVLLDLPDHDSTAVAHRLEVDRLVGLVDLLVWVVDPQKYADEALHRGYLRPLVGHDEVMVVVLNQVDKLADTEVETCLKDLRRLMDADGLTTVRILATSARDGNGVDELRELLEGVVQGRSAFLTRTRADLDEAARTLRQGLADTEPDARHLPAGETLVSAMASAAGLPVLLDTVAAEYRRAGTQAVAWPIARAWTVLGADPLHRLGLGGQAEERLRELTRASLATPSPAQRERVDLAVRDVASEVAEQLPPRWGEAVRRAASPDVDELAGALDDAVNTVDLTVRRPLWWTPVLVVQYLLVACAVAGFLWLSLLGVLRWEGSPQPDTPYLDPVPLPTALFFGGVLLGAVLGWVATSLVRRGARRRRAEAVEELRAAVGEVAWHRVVGPIAEVLEDHRSARQALTSAF